MRFKVHVFIDRHGDFPYVKAIGRDVVEGRFLLLLDGVLEAEHIPVGMNLDSKYASRIFPEDPTIQQKQGRRRSTDYCKSIRVTQRE